MLYKYLPPSRVDVLVHGRLRCTPPAALNDPYEALPVVNAVIPEARVREELDRLWPEIAANAESDPKWIGRVVPKGLIRFLMRRVPALYRLRLEVLKNLSSMLDESLLPDLRDVRDTHLVQLRTSMGIVSLSARADCPVMWAHYAANHSGMAIGYDVADPPFSRIEDNGDSTSRLLPVQYVDAGVDVYTATGPAAFFAKASRWAYEEEWRMIVPLNEELDIVDLPTGERIHLLGIPHEAVKCVIVGARASDTLIRKLRHTLNRSEYAHVALYKGTISPASFRVEAVPMDAA